METADEGKHVMNSRVPPKLQWSLVALASAVVLQVLAGCGTTTATTLGTSSTPSGGIPCEETLRAGEYACVDGRLPRDHVERGCVVYGSVYSIDFWHCERDER